MEVVHPCPGGVHLKQRTVDDVNMTSPSTSRCFLLSGASGMLGSALRQALEARRLAVLQLVRNPPVCDCQLQWNPNSSRPLHEPETLGELAAAIHLAGANLAARRWTPSYKQELVSSRVNSTRALATMLAGLRHPPPILVVASACGIYGNRGDELLDETSAAGSGFLADLCRQWEDAAQPAADAGIRVVHLRLGVVLGPGPGALTRMIPLFRLGLGGKLGAGSQWMSWISLADAIAAIVFALRTPTLTGPVNLTAPNPVTNAQFTRALAGTLHRPALFHAPAFALRLLLGEMADEALLSSTRVFPSRLTTAGFQFTHPLVEQALADALAEPLRRPALS